MDLFERVYLLQSHDGQYGGPLRECKSRQTPGRGETNSVIVEQCMYTSRAVQRTHTGGNNIVTTADHFVSACVSMWNVSTRRFKLLVTPN